MSTSETVEMSVAVCPCGKGHIVQSITTQDNPWSTPDIGYFVRCSECSTLWSADRAQLTSIPDKTEKDRAFQIVMDLSRQIDSLVADEVNRYFDNPKFKNMAQEQREMSRLGLVPRDIRNYRNGRNAGKAYADLCRPTSNPQWLCELVKPSGKLAELDRLMKEREAADEAWRSKPVRRIRYKADPYQFTP